MDDYKEQGLFHTPGTPDDCGCEGYELDAFLGNILILVRGRGKTSAGQWTARIIRQSYRLPSRHRFDGSVEVLQRSRDPLFTVGFQTGHQCLRGL